MDNFPETTHQLTLLNEVNKSPKIICYREFDAKVATDAILNYRFDPVTEKTMVKGTYSVTPEVITRLVDHPM